MTMDKIPQECRDIIGSFVEKQDRSNLALVSKRFYDYFSSTNWRSITLRGTSTDLYRKLGFFLDGKYAHKYPLIRAACMSVDYNPWGPVAPVGLTKRIVDTLSRMTNVRFISLHMMVKEDGLNFAEFARGMAAAPRWDKVTHLVLDCDEAIAAAALDRCELEVLGHVTLTDWCWRDEDEDLQYRALKSRYAAQPHLLKSLEIHFPYQEVEDGIWDMIHEKVTGVHRIVDDFPSLNHLHIGNEASKYNSPTFDDASYQAFDDEIEELCKVLNNTTLKDFTIDINATLVDRDFIAQGLQEILPADYPNYFDNGDYLDDNDEEFGIAIDNWFFQLTKRIGTTCPHLRSVTVSYGGSKSAFFERYHGTTFEYIHHGTLQIWPGDGGLCE